MYKIEKKSFGYEMTFSGFIQKDEADNWYHESVQALSSAPESFCVFVDMRDLVPLPPESQGRIEEGQKLVKQKGLLRSVVILNSPITTMQFRRIGRKTGIDAWERYIDASSTHNWKEVGIKWLERGVDPG